MRIRKAVDALKELSRRHRRRLTQTVAAMSLLAAGGIFVLFGPPKVIELTETPKFCALCHSSQSGDWLHSSHRTRRCIDCHLPNDNLANHYLWKSIDGNKDLFFHFSGLGDGNDTELTPHGKKVLQANCIRCHEGMVWRINNKRACIDCHRPLGHRRTAPSRTREEMINENK